MEFLYEQLGLLGPAMAILILVLVTGVVFLWKALTAKEKKSEKDRDLYMQQFKDLSKEHQEIITKFNEELKVVAQQHAEQIERISKEHKEEVKKLNSYKLTYLETIRNLITILDEVEKNQEQISVLINGLKK